MDKESYVYRNEFKFEWQCQSHEDLWKSIGFLSSSSFAHLRDISPTLGRIGFGAANHHPSSSTIKVVQGAHCDLSTINVAEMIRMHQKLPKRAKQSTAELPLSSSLLKKTSQASAVTSAIMASTATLIPSSDMKVDKVCGKMEKH